MGFADLINNRIYLRLFTNSAALIVVGIIVSALFYQKSKQFNASKIVKWEVVDTKIIVEKPVIPKNYGKVATKNNTNTNGLTKANNNYKASVNQNNGVSQQAIAQNNQSEPSNSNKGNPILPSLPNSAKNTIVNTECFTKVDIEDRPKGCPPNDIAKKLIQAARAPKYRPELVESFSRAEVNAKYYAGMRDKCQKEDGGKYMACVPIGKKPPRVKTQYELCVEMGMGGCTRPPRPDGSKDASFNYGNE